MKVQPFKVGLDYIDPGYHSLATGRQGENLDGFLMSEQAILEAFQHSAVGSDIAIVEGVRGLYEGLEALSDIGSTAQIAKLLKNACRAGPGRAEHHPQHGGHRQRLQGLRQGHQFQGRHPEQGRQRPARGKGHGRHPEVYGRGGARRHTQE